MMDEKSYGSDLCFDTNTIQEDLRFSTRNNNFDPAMSSLTFKKPSSMISEDLNDVANPFESASFDSLSMSTQINTKTTNHNLEMDNLNETFEKLNSRQQLNNDSGMSLSGQDMPDMDSLKADDADENRFQSGEFFQDPGAYDFLMSIGSSNKNSRDYSKESLFVKFDPLLGKHILPSGPRTDSVQNANSLQTPLDSEQNENPLHSSNDLTNVSVISMSDSQSEKEENSSTLATTEKELTSNKVQQKTPTKNSAIEVLDRLISLTPTSSPHSVVATPEPVKEVPKIDKEKMQYIEELKQLRQLITKQEQEYEELQKQLSEEKSKVDLLSNKEQALVKRIAEKTKMEQQMGVVMNEYEKNLAQLISDRELEKQKLEEQVQQMTSERDVAMQHLSSVESAFSDVHQKYERCKIVIEQFKANEETLKADNASLRELVKQQDTRYDTLKAHAISQLDKANADLEALKRKQEMEVVKCTALLKKAELKTISLQEALTQKQKENEELITICDGLIQKVG